MALSELDQFVASLDQEQKTELDAMLGPELGALWLPEPENEPQAAALPPPADPPLSGGAAGGGKPDLLAGLPLTQHSQSVIFRRQAVDLRGIEDRLVALAGRAGWNAARPASATS